MGSVDLPQVPLVLNGETISNDSKFPVHNPLTGEVIYYCSSASPADAHHAINKAPEAFHSWSKTPPSQRREIFMKAADILISKSSSSHNLMSQEVAATTLWRNANIFGSAAFIREAAVAVSQIKGEIVPSDRPGTTTLIFREPVGVVLSIVPWNAPLNLALRAICLPIACGNTVVLKPSEYTPASQHLVIEAFTEAGLPPGVLNFLPTSAADAPAITELCVKSKEVRRVNFTGSTRVGKVVARWAAEELKQCIFELGGKASVIVMEDANIEDAVRAIAFGGMMNSGQLCMSSERILLHESIASTFTDKLIEQIKKLKVGNDVMDKSVDLSGLYCENSANRVMSLIESAISGGARLLLGNRAITHNTIIQPHILSGVKPNMDIWYEESFGPVLTITTFKAEEEAVRMANDTDTSLCSSVFSADVIRATRIARQLRTGSTHINGPTIFIEPSLPNGGTGGASGYGRFGGSSGIREFTDERILTINEPGQVYPLIK